MLLSDVLIIDATDRLGWVGGRVLADLGADVVKLEPPGSDRGGADWRAFNVSKRMLELDLQAPSDRARLEDLLRAADICLLTPSDSSAHLDPHALRENIRGWGGSPSRRSAASGPAAHGKRATTSSWPPAAPMPPPADPT